MHIYGHTYAACVVCVVLLWVKVGPAADVIYNSFLHRSLSIPIPSHSAATWYTHTANYSRHQGTKCMSTQLIILCTIYKLKKYCTCIYIVRTCIYMYVQCIYMRNISLHVRICTNVHVHVHVYNCISTYIYM